MKTLLQLVILFFAPLVVMKAVPTRQWWGLIGIAGFIFAYFWTRHAKIGKEEHFFRQLLFSVLVTAIVTVVLMYFVH